MAHQYGLDVCSVPPRGACIVRSFALLGACLALLASPLACQSDEKDEGVEVHTTMDTFGVNAGAAGTAGMAGSSGNPPAAPSNTPPGNESAAVQNLTPAAPANGSNAEAAAAAAGNAAPPAPAPSVTFEACTYTEGNYGRNCDSLYVSMKQASPARCVQLTFDNCGEYGRDSLPVDVPMPWRLDSGTIGTNLDECELGVFYPTSSVALRASGSVTWNETTRLPSELVLDVALATSTSATDASIELTTTTPITASVCKD